MAKRFEFGNGLVCGEICPKCSSDNQHTIDSRMVHGQRLRRRMCVDCGCRWNTIEVFYNFVGGNG